MSLLQKLQSALNKINGNILTIYDDNRGYDEFFCIECNSRVYEDQYNHLKRVCYKCWFEKL